jgi:hypothetical protein
VLVLPAGQPHAIKFVAEKTDKAEKPPEKVVAVQFLTSARAAGTASSPVAPSKSATKARPTPAWIAP